MFRIDELPPAAAPKNGVARKAAGAESQSGLSTRWLPLLLVSAACSAPVVSSSPASAPQAQPTSAEASDRPSMNCTQEAPAETEGERDPWSRVVHADLSKKLAELGTCTRELPTDSEVGLTLRLVYDEQGRPLSQHVVRADTEACGAVACITSALEQVIVPILPPERDQYFDLSLELSRGQPPTALPGTGDPLTEHTEAEPSCVDPQILKLSRTRVEDVIKTTFSGLRTCHAHALERDHQAGGAVTFEFVVGEDGDVSRARVRESTFADCEALECMLSEFLSLSFSPPVGRRLRILYPIEFAVQQESVNLR